MAAVAIESVLVLNKTYCLYTSLYFLSPKACIHIFFLSFKGFLITRFKGTHMCTEIETQSHIIDMLKKRLNAW